MSNADDFRTAIQDMRDHFVQDLMQAAEDGKFDSWNDAGDRIMALIAEAATDPARCLAILSLVGAVREGFLITDNQTGHWQVFASGLREDVHAYVVVPPHGGCSKC